MKHSTNDEKHPYMRGYVFWSKNRFWKSGLYSAKTQKEYDEWVENMRKTERSLTLVDASITKINEHR